MSLTKEHYEVIKYAFDREEARLKELVERGKIFLSVIVIYMSALTLKTNELTVLMKDNSTSALLFTVMAIAVIVSLLLTLLSLGIYKYEEPWDARKAAVAAGAAASIGDFFEDRVIDLAVATKRNIAVNNKRATLLSWTSCFLAVAIACHLIAFLLYAHRTK